MQDEWSKVYVKWISQTFELLKNKQKFITTLIYNTLTEFKRKMHRTDFIYKYKNAEDSSTAERKIL